MQKEFKEVKAAAAQAETAVVKAKELEAEAKELKKQVSELDVLYKKEMQLRKKYYNQIEDMKGKIRVYARCRPFAKYELEKECKQCITFKDDQTADVLASIPEIPQFDHLFCVSDPVWPLCRFFRRAGKKNSPLTRSTGLSPSKSTSSKESLTSANRR